MPISKINQWLEKEKQLGSKNPENIVLATASANGQVHSRVVAIREITDAGILFFTQRETTKVKDLQENPLASMTLWLPLQQREVVLEGATQALTKDENNHYWETLPRERQLRFSVYASRSGKPISSYQILENEYKFLSEKFEHTKIPMSEFYCGYRLVPQMIYFYAIGNNTFSEVTKFFLGAKDWEIHTISP